VKNDSEVLEPRLVAVNSYYLSVINNRIQDLSNDAESLTMALSAISTDDDTSKGVIVAVRSALLANSELATILSEQIDGLILLPELEVTDHDW
jgi:hypothetical protein